MAPRTGIFSEPWVHRRSWILPRRELLLRARVSRRWGRTDSVVPDDGFPEGGPDDGSPEGGPNDGSPEGGPNDGSPEGGPNDGSPEGGPNDGFPDGDSPGVDSSAARPRQRVVKASGGRRASLTTAPGAYGSSQFSRDEQSETRRAGEDDRILRERPPHW